MSADELQLLGRLFDLLFILALIAVISKKWGW